MASKVATVAAVAALVRWFPSTSKEPGILAEMGVVAIVFSALGVLAANKIKRVAGSNETPAIEFDNSILDETPAAEIDNSILDAAREAAKWMTAEANTWHEVNAVVLFVHRWIGWKK